jgi:hypothetical protein
LWRSVAEIAPPLAISRAALAAVALAAVAFLPLNVARCLECAPSGIWWLDAFARWDGRWYVSVAEIGYVDRPGVQSNLAYFPLYPVAMRILAAPFGADRVTLVASGLVLSGIALVAALVLLVRLARLDVDAPSAGRAALYALAYPTTILLSAVYAESTFLALGVAAFWYGRRGRWRVAGILSALAALARPFGVVVALALAVELATAHPASRRRPAPWAWLALGPLALAGWAGYLFSLTGRPLAFVDAHTPWEVRPGDALSAVTDLADPRVYGFPWAVVGLLALALVLAVYAWRLRTSYGAYCALMLAALVSPGTLTSSMRHELGLFPVFIVLGGLGARRWVHWGYLVLAAGLSVVFAAMFALSHWIG